jgi:chemotaxis protein histidine kinase CheA
MASGKSSKPEVLTYGDYEMITPDTTKLRKLLRPEMPGEDDPVARAEQALAAISGDFTDWMQDECTRLDNARLKVRDNGLSKQTRQELFLAAHDIKGDSGTLGYPEVGPAAESLCRLLEHTPDLKRIPLAIVDQHVDAVRAIVREHGRADVSAIAAALTKKLRSVTDEFLIKENQHRPDVLKVIQSPTIAPNDTF